MKMPPVFRMQRGFLTETPRGDIFDVLLSNVPRYVLNQYDAAVVIGPTKIEGQLQTTLQDFINRGGSVATTAAQLTKASAAMFGVRLAGSTSMETTVNWTAGGSVTESNFTLHHLNPLRGARVVAKSPAGYPVVVKYNDRGRWRVDPVCSRLRAYRMVRLRSRTPNGSKRSTLLTNC